MVFIGYSSKDRYEIVEHMIFHLKNYGIDVWYDFHDMFIGDDRFHTNFEYGIAESKYVIFIISPDFFKSNCAMEELNYAQKLYEENKITLFPILYLLKASELPAEYNWIKKIIYNEVDAQSGTLFVTNQIIEKILYDIVKNLPFRSFSEIANFLKDKNTNYLCRLAEAYLNLDKPNYSARIAILYAIFLYITSDKKIQLENYIPKIVNRIVTFTSLNISLDHLTFSIFELTILIALNKFL